MIEGPVRAGVDDLEGILEVADASFVKDRDLGGMLHRWPHCYICTPEFMGNFLVMKDNGRVVACLVYVDQELKVDGQIVKDAGISAVATLPEYRGQGMMSRLLTELLECMNSEGYAISELGGQRQRYNRYGWEFCGRKYIYTLRERTLGSVDYPDLNVSPYSGTDAEMAQIMEIHDRESCGLVRNPDLYNLLLNRLGWGYFVAKDNGRVCAYAAISGDSIVEFGGSESGILNVIGYLIDRAEGNGVTVHSPWIHELNPLFVKISSYYSVSFVRNLKIVNLRKTLEGFGAQLIRKFNENGLSGAHRVAFGIRETGQKVCLEISNQGMAVNDADTADILLPEIEMVQFLFRMGTLDNDALLPEQAKFLRTILPLDYFIWRLEGV